MMRSILLSAALSIPLLGAGAIAGPVILDVRHAAARVVLIPEARRDVVVSITNANRRLPLRVSQFGDEVRVEGNLGWRSGNCKQWNDQRSVYVWGVGSVGYEHLPVIIVHAPMDVRVKVGSAVFGAVGRSTSVDISDSGCGDWTVADVSGPLKIALSGSADIRTGRAGSAKLHISGSGNVTTQAIADGLDSATAGSGDISAASVSGPMRVSISGSGNVVAHAGAVTALEAHIAGSGDVTFKGTAQSLQANIAGSGDINVNRVTGNIDKHVAGSGDVRVGN